MDDSQRIVKCGALSLHSQGGFFKRRWLSKYLVLYDGSKSGIKRLELFDSEIKFKKQNPAKIIALVDCIRVVTCQRGHKTSYTFEVRTSEQFYLLAAQSFQDMNDWVNCLRSVAFGEPLAASSTTAPGINQTTTTTKNNPSSCLKSAVGAAREPQIVRQQQNSTNNAKLKLTGNQNQAPSTSKPVDILLDKHRQLNGAATHPLDLGVSTSPAGGAGGAKTPLTASQAAAAAASATAKARQRQPSLLGSCKPQPPSDSPFIHRPGNQDQQQQQQSNGNNLLASHNPNTLTPSVRGQLITAASCTSVPSSSSGSIKRPASATNRLFAPTNETNNNNSKFSLQQQTLDEEEENMLYCSIEDNPSEHNYRVKVIETELSLRCQLKCYQLTAPTTIDQQYEQLPRAQQATPANLQSLTIQTGDSSSSSKFLQHNSNNKSLQIDQQMHHQMVTFYQLIIGPQELTLLNDYATFKPASAGQQQGLWSWPYQCIRRYGFDKDNCFMFEAGRKCTSGPGQFIVQTPKAYSIYQDVVKFVNELRSLSSNNSQSQQSTIKPVANDFTIRTLPLPPTPSTSTTTLINTSSPQITHIPVNWTNNTMLQQTNSKPATSVCQDNTPDLQRDHFFQSLHQSVAITSNNQPIESASIQHNPTTSDPMTMTFSESQLQQENVNKKTPPKVPAKPTSISSMLHHQTASATPKPANNSNSTASEVDSGDDKSSSSSSAASSLKIKHEPTKLTVRDSSGFKSHEETDESGYEGANDKGQDSPVHVAPKQDLNKTTNDTSNNQQSARSRLLNIKRSATNNQMVASSGANDATKKQPQSQSATPADPKSSQVSRVSSIGSQPKPLGSTPMKNVADARRRQHDDFEASLIRDVYCEISKLHATFAVVSNDSTSEDSISSHSSRSSRTSIANSTDTCGNRDHESSSSCSSSSSLSHEDSVNSLSGPTEPTYTNLSRPRTAQANASNQNNSNKSGSLGNASQNDTSSNQLKKSEDSRNGRPPFNNQTRSNSQAHSSSYDASNIAQRDFNQNQMSHQHQQIASFPAPPPIEPLEPNYSVLGPIRMVHPMYLGCMLNPIPEVGEPPSSGTGPSALEDHTHQASSILKKTSHQLHQKSSPLTHSHDKFPKNRPQNQKPVTTNQHYLINDVEYAKISRK